MSTAVPQFYEIRIRLNEIEEAFREFIGDDTVVNIGETMRVMLGDYFYGEPPAPLGLFHTEQDRTIVFAFGQGRTLSGVELTSAIDVMGEIFWSLADAITHRALQVTPHYTHKPNECLYKFFPHTKDLVIYTPVLEGLPRLGAAPMDGRSVIIACQDTLPSWLKSSL